MFTAAKRGEGSLPTEENFFLDALPAALFPLAAAAAVESQAEEEVIE